MQELVDLFSNRPDFWMSMIVIVLMLIGCGYFVYFVVRNIREDVRAPERDYLKNHPDNQRN